MTTFDVDQFNLRVGRILAAPIRRSTSLKAHCLRIEKLRADYRKVNDKVAQGYVDRTIDKLVLLALINTCQPFAVVSRQFRRNFNRGFHSPWTEAFSTIEFAYYCLREDRASKGLLALQVARKRLSGTKKGFHKGEKNHLLQEIDTCMQVLQHPTHG